MTSRLPDFLKSRPQAGIDGCPDGWICVYQDSSQPNGVIKSSIIELIDFLPEDTRIAIDIPIGLTDKGPRQCDRAARRFLGSPRNASVFSAPIRPVLQAKNYKEALALHRQADGRGMSKQAYNIMSKIREVDAALRALAEDSALPSRRPLLECQTRSPSGNISTRALNDVVLGWGTSSHIAHLHVSVDGEHLTTYTCDGLILSTPTGSTGHSLSAGGPILSPDSRSLVLSPICPNSMTVRPVVLPATATVTIELDRHSKPLVLACDGQSPGELAPGDQLQAHLGEVMIELLHLPGYSYWQALRTKLHWRGSNVEARQ